MAKKSFLLTLSLLAVGVAVLSQPPLRLVDSKATRETRNLYQNLHRLAESHILFGHQHATEYGHGWSGDKDRSDVKSVTGSNPAVIGVDFAGLSGQPTSEIEKEKARLRKIIADTYDRGGITTVSWHFNNPVSGGGFYWKDSVSAPAVKYIIPGGTAHQPYKEILKQIGSLANSVRGRDGAKVPMIFRPYHEFDGDWFWWGRSHSTTEEFKKLWRFTVSYLRDSLKIHNFIYAFSPDNLFTTEAQYLERYPGDEWVDMVGVDNYGDFGRYGKYNLEAGFQKLKIVSAYAQKTGKLAAFTETGLESIPDRNWWTESLLKTLKRENLKLSYVLVWRNDTHSPTHFYAAFPGHASVGDFLKFYDDDYTIFEKDLINTDLYGKSHRVMNPVNKHGSLKVQHGKLVDKHGQLVALRGMSFGWHNWWPRFYNAGAVHELVTKWNCTVLRAAMGVDPKDGYIQSPDNSVRLVKQVVDACIKEGVYVIIDWHSHNIRTAEAKQFFELMARTYGRYPNVIYEIFNEPVRQSWDSLKMYSEEIIRTIRKYDPDNIILVGSPHWDQDIHIVADDPLTGFNNLMYTMHFYAATHKQSLRDRTDYALGKGLPIFVSECAGMEATGNGPINHEEWNRWVRWMDERDLSWVAWSVADKDETCSILLKTAGSEGGWNEADLKEWGKMTRKYLNKYGNSDVEIYVK